MDFILIGSLAWHVPFVPPLFHALPFPQTMTRPLPSFAHPLLLLTIVPPEPCENTNQEEMLDYQHTLFLISNC